MAIVRSDFLTEIATELEEYGEWETSDGGALNTNLLYAMRDFWEKRDWSFKFSAGALTATEGNQGPYDPPGGFDSLVSPEAVSRYFDYDRFAVPPSIPDASDGRKYDILWNRLTGKLYFRDPPAAGSYTFYFRRALSATTDLSNWPDAARRFLRLQTLAYCLKASEDTEKKGKGFEQDAERAWRSMLYDLRRGESKQEQREPRDVYGYPLAASYGNEGDGFLGGC